MLVVIGVVIVSLKMTEGMGLNSVLISMNAGYSVQVALWLLTHKRWELPPANSRN